MRRLIILIAVLMTGSGATALYDMFPPEVEEVMAEIGEDGNLTLVTAGPEENAAPKNEVSFSLPAGFYDRNISVELSALDGAEIYVTTDGSDPKPDSSFLYNGAIDINSGMEVTATTIKAFAVMDGEQSGMFTASYIIGTEVFERFDSETLVFVLSTDPYNLYDYEYGIAVPGKIYDDYVKEHPGEEIPYNAPGNYYMSGREAERDMYVEVFESSGANVISQAAGVRIVGGYSRVPDQKSLKLIARKEYDPNNGKFKYPFFPDAVTEDGTPIYKYDRLVLRNGANDREFAGVRDELSQQLARDYGFPTTQHTVPCAVFLNGEYYGFSWLHENYNEDYLATQFGGDKDNYEIVSNTEVPHEGNQRGLDDYAKVVEYYDKDLTNDAVFKEFCKLVDIENLMQYYCMEVFISNKDWPGNNYKAFRYYPAEGEEITSEFMDGRWRYLFFDAEYAWGLYGEGFRLNTLSDLLSGNHMSGESKALKALLQREDMQELFANIMCDMTSYAFSPYHIIEVLDTLCEKSDKEQFYALGKGITSTWANEWTFADSRDQIRKFAQLRYNSIGADMRRIFSMSSSTYDISAAGAEGASVKLSTQRANGVKTVFASYYIDCTVKLSAEVYDGYSFLRWEINGEEYSEPELTITADMAKDGKVYARLFTEKAEQHGQPLQVSVICTDSNAGYIKLFNPNSEKASTAGLYLSDDPEKPQRWAVPATEIEPLGELVIVMKNNKSHDALMKIQADFSLKKNETLILSDADGIIQSIPIPVIPEGRVYRRQDNGGYAVAYS